MKKKGIVFIALAVVAMTMVSCGSSAQPVGPTSKKSDKPWNDQMRPEGVGAFRLLDQR